MNLAIILRSFGINLTDAEVDDVTATLKAAPQMATEALAMIAEMRTATFEARDNTRFILAEVRQMNGGLGARADEVLKGELLKYMERKPDDDGNENSGNDGDGNSGQLVNGKH